MRNSFLFTSESVSEGHPDKVADQISDSIVDLFLAKDPEARVACETLTTTQLVVLAGEIRCKGVFEDGEWAPGALDEIEATVRRTVREIGYEQAGFHWNRFRFENNLHGQSPQIAQGVDEGAGKDEGAGDQGIMFGYASDETPDFMPATLDYSHKILERMASDRKAGIAPFLEPDAKSQVTLRYANERPVEATAIVVSTQHAPGYYFHNGEGDEAKYTELRKYVLGVIADVLPAELLTANTVYHINPTGRFEIGGPDGDAGLTGRKIIVDTYGGASPHGGGAFSGKDPTKVDRSAAYITRYLAKNIVAAGLARRCTIQLSYAIGVAEPLSIYVDLHGTGTVDEGRIEAVLPQLVRLTPKGIRTHLGLNKPIYRQTAAYGHFGRQADGDAFPWERTDLVDKLKAALAV
ncbi:methionine adenosyltransferase [Sphingopyxis alaskensis]|jgi:S-adenosylmethionine synthetase|uniref:S-adenosylmethionine synthase n=1 Tax=Sphingopyxis alaskensis (strain DSM 13593 / LMG 18877 / RB2256) TaxID=317655 RepID=METK_SPHAL|nr:methionine adenosyltransferase [Sphingopyxis alaskensis]Q1GND0.1 RecName: Full=S-adenosylmethionine synthase; Short=AdoMet synthase; AltName: Full=MAT; AltName: Full=Methionine adenosyltransferase [Sphingopyxis alaskensis RB2256]ABF54842.1 methionine adenosyltransferase [Sphingopyxis alaskensis RB2256]MCM3419667.1 methionine adenosyltransferase [Sphingopyxis alaskensis]